MCVVTLLFSAFLVAISSELAETMGLTRHDFNARRYRNTAVLYVLSLLGCIYIILLCL